MTRATADRPYIWDPWSTARTDPRRMAVIADDESCTFGELVARADRLAAGLAAAGLPDDATLSTDIAPGPRFFALALAALRYGCTLLPISSDLLAGPSGTTLLAGVWLHVGHGRPIGVAAADDDAIAAAGIAERPPDARTAGQLIFATSGTTGVPTVVPRVRSRYRYRGVAVLARYAAGPAKGPHVMANPTFHLGTLGPAMYALQAGSTVVVQRTWSPAGLIEIIDRYRADSVFLSPDRLLDVVDHGAWAEHRPQAVFHGGSPCAPMVKRQAITLLGPTLHEYYGTSRGIVSEITTPEWLRHPGSVGRPLAGVRVRIQDGGVVRPDGAVGEIHVLLRAADRHSDERSALPTGDAGYLDRDGYLHVLGRIDGEHRWDCVRFEHAVRSLAGVTDVAVLVDRAGDRVTCCAEGTGTMVAALPDLIHAVAAETGVGTFGLDLRPSGGFPRTPSGKIRWAAVRH